MSWALTRPSLGGALKAPSYAPAPALSKAKKQCQQSLINFETALAGYDAASSARFKTLCKRDPPGLADVVDTVDQIVASANKRHPTTSRRFATTFIRVLERIRDFASIGDVFVGGAQNMVASGVWGAVRVAIEISLAWLKFYEKVSEMLFRIGKFSSVSQDFAALFPNSQVLKAYAWDYMASMVDIATKVVTYAQRSKITQILSTFAKTFDAEFQPLEEKLQILAQAMRDQVQAEAIRETQTSQTLSQRLAGRASEAIYALSRDTGKARRETARSRLLQSLNPDQHCVRPEWQRQFAKGRSSWILNTNEYTSWRKSGDSSILWLEGNLGSGKSVTMASIVADLTSSNGTRRDSQPARITTLSYYFCESSGSRLNAAAVMVGSLVRQVLESAGWQEELDTYLDKASLATPWDSSADAGIDLLLKVTTKAWRGYVVLDGLDQCLEKEVAVLMREMARLSDERQILFIFSSRAGWVLHSKASAYTRMFKHSAALSMEGTDRSAEAQSFIDAEMLQWEEGLTTEEAKEAIKKRLLLGWGDMFLWLSLQLQVIRDELLSDVGFLDVLARLPIELSDLYDRLLQPIADRNDRLTRPILEIVAAAQPCMTLKELRIAANISPGKPEWDPVDVTAVPHAFCSRYGSFLLEVDEEDDRVRFIHPSVAIHLCQAPRDPAMSPLRVNIEEAQKRVGLVCVTFLSLMKQQQVAPYRRKSPMSLSVDPLSWASQAVIRDDRESRWLGSLYQNHSRSRSRETSVEFVYNAFTKSLPAFSLADFNHYAESHWVESTRNFAEPILPDLLEPIAEKYPPEASSISQIRYDMGLIFDSVIDGHYPLFIFYLGRFEVKDLVLLQQEEMHYSGSGPTNHVQWPHFYRTLSRRILTEWPQFSEYSPLLVPCFSWLRKANPELFGAHWERITRLLYSAPIPPGEIGDQVDCANTLLHCLVFTSRSVADAMGHDLSRRLALFVDGIDDECFRIAEDLLPLPHLKTRHEREETLDLWMVLLATGAMNPDSASLGSAALAVVLQHTSVLEDIQFSSLAVAFGANVECRTSEGDTPLLSVVRHGNDPECARILIEAGARLDSTDKSGATVLHHAARRGDRDMLKYLLENVPTAIGSLDLLHKMDQQSGTTALFEAVVREHLDCALLLLRRAPALLFKKNGRLFEMTAYHSDKILSGRWSEDTVIEMGMYSQLRDCSDATMQSILEQGLVSLSTTGSRKSGRFESLV